MMNKIYKVIWNAALQCWVAVSELGKAKGKTKSKKVLSAAVLTAVASVAAVEESWGGVALVSRPDEGIAISTNDSTKNASAKPRWAIAIGNQAVAKNGYDIAIGGTSFANSTGAGDEGAAIAIGKQARATKNGAVSLGRISVADKQFSTAVGSQAAATGDFSAAFGSCATASAGNSLAAGVNSKATNAHATALGEAAHASGDAATAVGQAASASGANAFAGGTSANALGSNTVSIGKSSGASGDRGVAIGMQAIAKSTDTVAMGSWAEANNVNSTAIGSLSNASGVSSMALGWYAKASNDSAIAMGGLSQANGRNAIAIGADSTAQAENSTAIGKNANATANAAGSLVIGRGAVVNATDATVVGPVAQANGANATAVGRGAVANGNQSTALGKGSQAKVDSGVALGDGAVADRVARKGSEIVINNSKPSASTGFNDQDAATSNSVYAPVRLVGAPGALQLIKNTVKGNKGAVSVGDSGNTRQIINVAPGSADSDAVNVAQLKAVAGGIKKYSVTSPDNSITITPPVTGDDPQNFKIKMNTTAVQNAAAWNIKSGSESGNGEQVRGGQTVTFAGSDTINVVRNGKTLTFNANISNISNGSGANEGKPQTTDSGNKYLAKTKNVVDAINASGWILQANGNKVGLVNPGDKVNIKAGTGVTITPTNEANGISTLTISAASAAQQNYSWKLKEDSQTAAQALNVTNNTAVSLKGENYLNITNKGGGNFAFKTVTADVAYTAATGAVNAVSSATGLVTNKNLSDVIRNSGFQLKENGTFKDVVNPGESLNFKPGQGTTVSVGTNGDVQVNANVADIRAGNNVTVTKGNNGVVTINAKDTNTQASVANGTGLTLTESNNSNGTKKYTLGVNVDNNTIKVEDGKLVANLSGVTDTNTQSTVEAKANNFVTVDGSTKNTNGTTKYQVGVTTGDVAVTEATGAVAAISAATGVATNKTVADAIAKSGFQLQENGTLRNVVNPGEILNFKPGKGTTVSVGENGDVQINANVAGITAGKNITTNTDANGNVTINAKDTSAHVQAANNAAVKVDKAATTRTKNNADITDYTVDLTDQTKTNITHGVNANETVTNKGLTFVANKGDTGIKKLGSTVDVKGNTSNNVITTTANTNGITVDYNGTAAAQVTNLTYKANNANAKSVTLAKGLDFTNGTQTTAVVEDNGVVKFNVNTTDLSNATGNGNIQVPTGANSDGLVSAKNVANAINTSGWNLQANNVSVGLINPSDKVSFDAGNGITVTPTNEANGVSHIKVAAKVDGSTITVNDQGQLVANLSGAVNTQASVSNATSSPITIATTKNANGTNNYTVDVNVDGKTITKEGGVLKAVIPSVETVTLTVNTTGNNAGKVEAPATDADKKKLVTAENVAKAVNESFWIAKKGDRVETNADTTSADSNVAAGNNVTFIAGKNIALQKAGNKFIYATKDDVSFNNVTANNTTTTNLTVKNGGNVDMGGNQVHNVSTGTAPTDAVNVQQLYDTVSGNVSTESVIKKADEDNIAEVTVADNKQSGDKNAKYEVSVSKAKIKALANETVKVNTSTAANNPITVTSHTENGNTTYSVNFNGENASKVIPLSYKANDGEAKTVTLSEGLNFKNGTQTTAEVAANGVVKFNVNTTALSNVTNNGKITVPEGNGLVTAKEVAEAINASYWKANAGGNVDGATVTDNVTTGTEVFFAAGKNLKVKHSANNFTFSTADDVSFNNVTTNNLTVNAKGNVDMGGNQVHNVANGTKGTDAVNLDQLNATTATAKTEVKAGKNVSSVNESKDAKDGHTVYTIDAVDTSAHVKAAESNAAVKVEKAVTTRTDGNTTVTDYTVDLTDETKANITHGVNANTTVTTKGLTFNGNEGTTGIKKLGSEVDVKGGTANNVITTNATEAGITINYNGTEAAKVTHLTYKANGANAQSVNLTTGLDFTNGTQTTAEVAANGVVKFNVNTTALSNVTNNGKITVPEGNGLVTAKEVAEAINASYWKANAGGNVDGATVTDNVTTGTEVFFAAGKNLKVKHSANNFTFSTADDVSFNNVTTNNLTVNAKGNVDMGGNQVHNVANGTKGTDAVNLDQLNATTATANAGWVIKANGTNATTVKPNATVSLNNTDGNILITKNTANNNVTFNFNPNATFGVVGKDGKDGVDGSIGVNGKDGASVVINGKDGSIGLTGSKGADGKDGVSLTLKPEKGTTTVNAKDDGKEIERIKYTANGTTREVATLDDGLKFKGDSKQVINRTLGSQMNITGGANETTLTDNNIGVVYDKATNGLKVKLAKDVNLTTNGSVVIGNTTLNNNGFTITNKADPSKTVSVTDKGLNNGGNTIINVAPGVNGTDAVNLDQLNATTAIANAGWVIKANGTNATTVKPNATVSLNNTDGNILITKNKTDNNVTFNFNPNATFGVVGKDGKDGVDGSIGVNGKDGSSVVINGKDGSIGLNGKDGKNGLSIKGDQGPAGVDGKDGETKTRIVYEYADPKDPNKTIRENVATLNDGLRFTGNNGVENAHRLNTLVTIVGEGVDKAASANFTSASGNINVKADGKGTLEVQLAKNLKNIETINNGNSTITLNKDGGTTISGGDVSVDGNKVTNVKDGDVSANSKDAVNGSQLYHVMTNATAGWNLSVNNGKDKGNVKPGAQVDLNNTDGNIIISKTANNVTFNFNPNATFGVKGKDGKDGVDGSIGVNGKDGASVVINGKDGSIGLTGPKGADGKDGASANMSVQKGTTTVNTDRDGGKDVTRIVYTDKDKDGKDIKREVATLDDGLKFKGDSEQVINRTLGSQMNITGGADSTKLTDNNIGVVYDEATNGLKVKLSKDVDLGKDGSITIGGTQVTNNGLTIKNGPSVTEKGVDAGNKKVTNVADGDINETSKDAVNGSQLYQAVNNINKNVNAAKTELEEGDNVTITSRVGNNGQTIYKVSSTDNSAHVQGGSDAVSVTKAETTRRDGSTTVTDYTVDLSSKTKDDIKKGVDAHDTVTNKGLTFNADKGTTGAKKLGSQVAVNGDNKNIETVADTNGVKVKLKDDINVNSVTANTFKAGDTIVNTKGVQVAAKDDRGNNTNVVINEKGINAGNTRIQNVAAGRADTDAVNVSQLKGAVTQIGNHINKMDKNLRAGIAGAMAAGGLYHATLPGKSMVAAGAGTYKGESAVAVGYSRLSDNGKVGIKFSVNTNTRGDSGAAASVGYQW